MSRLEKNGFVLTDGLISLLRSVEERDGIGKWIFLTDCLCFLLLEPAAIIVLQAGHTRRLWARTSTSMSTCNRPRVKVCAICPAPWSSIFVWRPVDC